MPWAFVPVCVDIFVGRGKTQILVGRKAGLNLYHGSVLPADDGDSFCHKVGLGLLKCDCNPRGYHALTIFWIPRLSLCLSLSSDLRLCSCSSRPQEAYVQHHEGLPLCWYHRRAHGCSCRWGKPHCSLLEWRPHFPPHQSLVSLGALESPQVTSCQDVGSEDCETPSCTLPAVIPLCTVGQVWVFQLENGRHLTA